MQGLFRSDSTDCVLLEPEEVPSGTTYINGSYWLPLPASIFFFLVGSILCCGSIDYACLQLLVFMRLSLNFALLLILHPYHNTCWSWSWALFLLYALLHDRTEAMQTPFVIGPHGGVQTLSLTFDAKMAPFIINFVLLNPASSSHREESWIRCASFSESNFWDTRCWRLTV